MPKRLGIAGLKDIAPPYKIKKRSLKPLTQVIFHIACPHPSGWASNPRPVGQDSTKNVGRCVSLTRLPKRHLPNPKSPPNPCFTARAEAWRPLPGSASGSLPVTNAPATAWTQCTGSQPLSTREGPKKPTGKILFGLTSWLTHQICYWARFIFREAEPAKTLSHRGSQRRQFNCKARKWENKPQIHVPEDKRVEYSGDDQWRSRGGLAEARGGVGESWLRKDAILVVLHRCS